MSRSRDTRNNEWQRCLGGEEIEEAGPHAAEQVPPLMGQGQTVRVESGDASSSIRESDCAAEETESSRSWEAPERRLADSDPIPIRLGDDIPEIFSSLWDDTLAIGTWHNIVVLGAAAGGAVALREDADGEVRAYTAGHPLRWGDGSRVLRQFGEFTYQIPVIAGVYGWSLWTQDEQMHEFSKSLISAYTISSLTTVALKGITDTQRPTDRFENGRFGFPSFHTSSTFAIAAVIDEYYGLWMALPAYAVGGAVGWSRIDQREHDLSDVFFGAALGFVIGKTVAAAHVERFTRISVLPYYDPARRSAGFVVEKPF